jgi:hypothetical protein
MTPERWRQIEQLWQRALDCDTTERDAFLQKECAGDEDLHREVESLLETKTAATDFLAQPAIKQIVGETGEEVITLDSSRSLVGRNIGPYQVLSFIAAGGMDRYIELVTQNWAAM